MACKLGTAEERAAAAAILRQARHMRVELDMPIDDGVYYTYDAWTEGDQPSTVDKTVVGKLLRLYYLFPDSPEYKAQKQQVYENMRKFANGDPQSMFEGTP
jgi:hypothetical protein